jgi:hypothetical protein
LTPATSSLLCFTEQPDHNKLISVKLSYLSLIIIQMPFIPLFKTLEIYLTTIEIERLCSCPDEKTREVLKLVCDLYALDRIWKDIGTYRNVDYVAPNKAKVCARHFRTAISVLNSRWNRKFRIWQQYPLYVCRLFTNWQTTLATKWGLWHKNSSTHLIFQISSFVPQLACNRRPMHSTLNMSASKWYKY